MESEQSVFIADMVIHVSAYRFYKSLYHNKGYSALRRKLRDRWYSKSDQNKVIRKIHEDSMKTEA